MSNPVLLTIKDAAQRAFCRTFDYECRCGLCCAACLDRCAAARARAWWESKDFTPSDAAGIRAALQALHDDQTAATEARYEP